jgi:hypothetical protein
MAEITYDDGSYLIDGKRVWLVSGSIHYFRIPNELWRDRLLKAKRAGLNCITTYVPWNFHEPVEGEWDFQGDRDVAGFVRLAGELGLYVILRPGPYICSEWDFGGLPGWLTAKGGMSVRTNNAAYMHYFDKYFAQLLPRLADQQVTRNGPILLIQNENEYLFGDTPGGREYIAFISQLIRRAGFDIPIISCNMFQGPRVEGLIENVNTWNAAVDLTKQAHFKQPSAPLIVTEFWDGWFDYWGSPEHQTRDGWEVARRAMEILGCGAMFNYYMFHGGTNFDFWGCRLRENASSFQTTSYDYDAPIAEGGALTEKYYATRLVNMLAQHMAPYFASSYVEEPGLTVYDQTQVHNLAGTLGRWAIVTNNGRSEIQTVEVSLPDGEVNLTIPLGPIGAAAVPIDIELTPTATLDYAGLTPLGLFWGKVLVLHGPVGFTAPVSVNGQVAQVTIPDRAEPLVVDVEGLTVAVLNTAAAQRTWFVDDQLVIGPSYVGATADEVTLDEGQTAYVILGSDGVMGRKRPKVVETPVVVAPKLAPWKKIAVCTEPMDDELMWTKIDRPRTVDQLGYHYGYVWYRTEIHCKSPARKSLFFPDCADRATVFVNGRRIGVWGRLDGAKRTPMNVNLKSGTNVITVLVDNLGRFGISARLGELKGLYGHIFDAKAIKPGRLKFSQGEKFSKRFVPTSVAHFAPVPLEGPMTFAELEVPLRKVTPLRLEFDNVPHDVAIVCNDKMAGLFPAIGDNSFGGVTLHSELKVGKNIIRVVLWGDADSKALSNMTLYQFNDNLTVDSAWAHRGWEAPPVDPKRATGKDLPGWFRSSFPRPANDQPLFVRLTGASKGQLMLNGRNVGRFWHLGPQEWYYLPECWLEDENELLLFTEDGAGPTGGELAFRPNGPFG